MKFPFLASFVIFILVLGHSIRRNRRMSENSEESFWARESRANATRRKPLDDLEYVRVELKNLPTEALTEDEVISDCRRQVEDLQDEMIVNLTGMSNTDLKLKYGVANLPLLTSYDERYTLLVQTLQKWADRLWEKGYQEEAVRIMEEEVRIRADVGSAYRKLAKYYRSHEMQDKIPGLIATAESLQSASREVILRHLREEE